MQAHLDGVSFLYLIEDVLPRIGPDIRIFFSLNQLSLLRSIQMHERSVEAEDLSDCLGLVPSRTIHSVRMDSSARPDKFCVASQEGDKILA